MAWRTVEGEYLLCGGAHALREGPSGERLELSDGTIIDASHDYFRVSAVGEFVQWYHPPRTSSCDEELWQTNIYVVLERSLHDISVCDRRGFRHHVQHVLIQNLEFVPDHELPFDPVSLLHSYRSRDTV